MSVQSEINRISGNVTAALAAIAEKGVTVDSGSNSDDLATLIAAIVAGGGGEITVVFGTYTPAENTQQFTVTHGIGRLPIFVGFSKGTNSTKNYEFNHGYAERGGSDGLLVGLNSAGKLSAWSGGYSTSATAPSSGGCVAFNPTTEEVTFGNGNNFGHTFIGGTPYKWFAVG